MPDQPKSQIKILLIAALSLLSLSTFISPSMAANCDMWKIIADDTERSAKPFVNGDFHYAPVLNKKKPHNIVGFSIHKANKIVLEQKFKVLSIEEYKTVVFPLANAKVAIATSNDHNYLDLFTILSIDGDCSKKLPAIGKNGDAACPCVIVETTYGGMNPEVGYEVFELGKTAKKIASLKPAQSQFVFGKFNGSNRIQAAGSDTTYEYWYASGADSARPSVIFELTPGGWRLCLDQMRLSPAYSAKQIKQFVEGCCKDYAQYPDEHVFSLSPMVWQVMLTMIYSGHASDAWSLLDQVWPKGKKTSICGEEMSKEQFISKFKQQMKKSPFWNDLVILNKDL